jgi:hypothetical protein
LAPVASLLTCIWEVSVSNLGRDIDCTDWGVSWGSSIFPGKCLYSTSN